MAAIAAGAFARLRLTLHDDWRRIARRSWSFRLSIVSALLGAADVACGFVPRDGRAPWVVAGVSIVSLAAALSRLVAQPSMGAPE